MFLGHNRTWAVAVPVSLEALFGGFASGENKIDGRQPRPASFELERLAPLLDRFETLPFQCPLLKALQLQLTVPSGLLETDPTTAPMDRASKSSII